MGYLIVDAAPFVPRFKEEEEGRVITFSAGGSIIRGGALLSSGRMRLDMGGESS
jgi:hypothetical protein